jgi:hypothetical protein
LGTDLVAAFADAFTAGLVSLLDALAAFDAPLAVAFDAPPPLFALAAGLELDLDED